MSVRQVLGNRIGARPHCFLDYLGLDVPLETADGLMVKARAYRAHETTRAQRNSQLPVVR